MVNCFLTIILQCVCVCVCVYFSVDTSGLSSGDEYSRFLFRHMQNFKSWKWEKVEAMVEATVGAKVDMNERQYRICKGQSEALSTCLLYTSDAADDYLEV